MNAPVQLSELKGEARKTALANMTPKQRVSALLAERKGDIARMLPSHLNAERLLKVATIAATTTPKLLECEIPSLIAAVGQCAMFGLEPNTVLGHAYMIPFKKNEKVWDKDKREEVWNSRQMVQVVIGYKGLIDLARRSGQIMSIAAHEVCANDKFDFAFGLDERLVHRPADDNRGAITHFYAYAKLKDGGTAFEVMSVSQVNEIRDKSALKNGAKRDKDGTVPITGPWRDHYVEMGRKTAVRRLAKYLPLSVEFQKAAALDEAGEQGLTVGAIEGEFAIEQEEHTMGPGAEIETPPGSGFQSGATDATKTENTARAGEAGGGGGPTFEDAIGAIKAGRIDEARDIARGLTDGQREQIEAAIVNHQQDGPAPKASRRGRGNGNGEPGPGSLALE